MWPIFHNEAIQDNILEIPLSFLFMQNSKFGKKKETNSWFVQESGKKSAGTTYYYCNRNGYYKSRGTGRRHLKNQGTSKINAHCTAALKVQCTGMDCHLTVYKTHYAHKSSLGHLRIPESDRLAIAGKIGQGVDFQHILDEIRDKLGQGFQRIHLLTRKDITNIKKTYLNSEAQR